MGRPGCSGKSFKVQKGLERVEPGVCQFGCTDQQAPGIQLSPHLSARVTVPATAPPQPPSIKQILGFNVRYSRGITFLTAFGGKKTSSVLYDRTKDKGERLALERDAVKNWETSNKMSTVN